MVYAHEKVVCSFFEQCARPGDGVISWRVVSGCVSCVVVLSFSGVRAGTAVRGECRLTRGEEVRWV